MRRENYGHQTATIFTIFVECLKERRIMFRRLIKGLYSKTLIRTTGPPPFAPAQACRRRASAVLTNLATFKEFRS
jgi:hypothetical protein